jgi:uridine monophosphate synthetase
VLFLTLVINWSESPGLLIIMRERFEMRKVIDQTNLVTQLYELGSVQFGDFTMASGLQSPIYIDLRRLIARPVLLNLVALAYIEILDDLAFDHLAAVPYGALAIGTAVSLAMDRPLIFPRKEAKSHGTGRIIEGLYSDGDKVVIIEDLVTKGGSALKAIEVLEAAELVVSDVVVLIDREQGGREVISSHGYHLHAVLALSEMLNLLQEQEHISTEEAKAVREYLATTS